MLQREFKGKVVHGYVCTNLEGRGGGGGEEEELLR